ncbi:MAG: hypothetical protein JWP09_270 [Candidatus Taylorbacteria bacterium]|nr:hypothetical protein [Candidatus Taylorbacteria bacterium]
MEPAVINNNIPKFETPHSGGGTSKVKLTVIILIIIGAVAFNLWYYFGVFSAIPVAVVSEVVLPPDDNEKTVIASDLENRVAKISTDDRAQMMQSLAMRTNSEVKPEERVIAVQSFQN